MANAAGGGKRARPGGHQLRPEVLVHHQRQRILAGAARAVSERGYRETSVADVVKSAAVARARFYENFSSKQDCFFALYDSATEGALAAVEEACGEHREDFPQRVEVGLRALLGYLEADPSLARAWILEGPTVGAPINDRFERLIGDFAALLRRGRSGAPDAELPDTVEETVAGGLYWLLYYALLDGQPKKIGKLLPQLVEFSLIPFVGTEASRGAPTAG
jgi:AcrR family transcriptional regulator